MMRGSFTETTPPNHALQRFDGFGKPGEDCWPRSGNPTPWETISQELGIQFTRGKGLVHNQTESAGADEPTAPRHERPGCNRTPS